MSLHAVEQLNQLASHEAAIYRTVQRHLEEIGHNPVLMEAYLSLTESNLQSARNYPHRVTLPKETWKKERKQP